MCRVAVDSVVSASGGDEVMSESSMSLMMMNDDEPQHSSQPTTTTTATTMMIGRRRQQQHTASVVNHIHRPTTAANHDGASRHTELCASDAASVNSRDVDTATDCKPPPPSSSRLTPASSTTGVTDEHCHLNYDDDTPELYVDAVQQQLPVTDRSTATAADRPRSSWLHCHWCVLLVVCSMALSLLLTVCVVLLMSYVVLESDTHLSLVVSARRLPELCAFYRDHYLPWRSRYLPLHTSTGNTQTAARHWTCLQRHTHTHMGTEDDDDDEIEVESEIDEEDEVDDEDESVTAAVSH